MLKECSEVDVCMYILEGGREVSEQIELEIGERERKEGFSKLEL